MNAKTVFDITFLPSTEEKIKRNSNLVIQKCQKKLKKKEAQSVSPALCAFISFTQPYANGIPAKDFCDLPKLCFIKSLEFDQHHVICYFRCNCKSYQTKIHKNYHRKLFSATHPSTPAK